MNRTSIALLMAVLTIGSTAQSPSSKRDLKFAPDQWPRQELERCLALQSGNSTPGERVGLRREALGSNAMIAATSDPLAVHAGAEVLRHGGTAADAALTVALTQVALEAGAVISYAGFMNAVYYDAASGKVWALNAGYNTVQNESSPLTIPPPGSPSGRTALVPGFMAGVQALHDRFGKLSFASLFGPAIWVADHGVPLGRMPGATISAQKSFVTRLPAGKRILLHADGELYRTGELFRQPELAATLRKTATQGSAYMYKGDWARHFVDAVRSEGGRVALEDLAAYQAWWNPALETSYRGYQVTAPSWPGWGGWQILGGLKLAEAANLKKYGHYSTSPEALYYLIQIPRIEGLMLHAPPALIKGHFPDLDPSLEVRLSANTAERIWAHLRQPDWNGKVAKLFAGQPASDHTAAVVAVDRDGNVASLLHTSMCSGWGSSGIFVDGVSIPDPAATQQGLIAGIGPGKRLPEATAPVIVLKAGKPVPASVATGAALQEVTLQNLLNILDFGMDPKTSVDKPGPRGPFYGLSVTGAAKADLSAEAVGQGDFPEVLLDGVRARGQAIRLVPPDVQTGSWVGIQIEPDPRKLRGGASRHSPASVEAY